MRWSIFLALIAIPAFWISALVYVYGVNVPSYDEWIGMAPVFQAMEAGKLGWSDFAAQHNEHRLMIPRLIFFVAGWLTHWNTRVEMFLTVLVLITTAAGLWKLLEATGWREKPGTYLLFGAMAWLVLNPLQEQNLVFGFQMHFLLPLPLIIGAYLAALRLHQPWNYVVTAGLATAATFSMAVGLPAWLLIAPMLLLQPRTAGWRKWATAWGATFVVNAILYFNGYEKGAISWLAVLRKPWEAFYYFLVYLGAPFAWGSTLERNSVAVSVGAGLLIGVLAAAGLCWSWRKDAKLRRRSLPWLAVAGIGLLHGSLATIGRFQFGAEQAMQTRYIPDTAMVAVGLLVLGTLFVEQRLEVGSVWPGFVFSGAASMLILLQVLSVLSRFEAWPELKHRRLNCKAVVETIDVLHEPAVYGVITPAPDRLHDTVLALDRLGYIRPPVLKSAAIRTVADVLSPGDPRFGALELSPRDGTRIVLGGWATLPDRLAPADAVLLTYDNAQGEPILFGLVELTDDRPDILAKTQEPGFYRSGWHRRFSADELPAGATKIKAWAYDAELERAWRLPGEATVQRK